MKFFYENRIGVKSFSWLMAICMDHMGICWLYLCGVFLYAALLSYRRRKLKKMVAGMEKRKMDGTVIYVTKMPVTPSTRGVFRPKIVMPEVILKKYDREEFQTILLHEKTHIRLGHLLPKYIEWTDVGMVNEEGEYFNLTGSDTLEQAFRTDSQYVYIDRSAFQNVLRENGIYVDYGGAETELIIPYVNRENFFFYALSSIFYRFKKELSRGDKSHKRELKRATPVKQLYENLHFG